VSAARARAGEDEEDPGMAADQSGKEVFMPLDVQVRGGEVRKIGPIWKMSRRLGPLAGAWAGVAEEKELSTAHKVTAEVLGSSPRIGTIFVSFPDGTRHETPLRRDSEEHVEELHKAIEKFNAMAKAASG
jgi:hypothetical protein